MLKHIIDAAYQLASDNGLNEVCEFIAAVPVNSFKEVFRGAKTPEDVIAIAQEEMKEEEEEEEEEEEARVMDLMYKVMMGDQESAAVLHEITETSKKAASLAAEKGLDLVTFVGLLAVMADEYQSITKVSNDKLYEVWDAIPHIRGAVNDICGDPLEMSGI